MKVIFYSPILQSNIILFSNSLSILPLQGWAKICFEEVIKKIISLSTLSITDLKDEGYIITVTKGNNFHDFLFASLNDKAHFSK